MLLLSFCSAASFFSYYSISKCLYWKLIQGGSSYIATVQDTSNKPGAEGLFQSCPSEWAKGLLSLYCHEYLRIVEGQHEPPSFFWFHILLVVKKSLRHFLCVCSLTLQAAFRAFSLLEWCHIYLTWRSGLFSTTSQNNTYWFVLDHLLRSEWLIFLHFFPQILMRCNQCESSAGQMKTKTCKISRLCLRAELNNFNCRACLMTLFQTLIAFS